MAFLDELMKLSQANFGSGFAKMGQQVKEQAQNETLVELYNKFKVDRNELLTTHEQADALGKDFKGVDESEGFNFIDHMTKNLMKVTALTELYQPFITSFATLGDDGVKVAERLTNELATKLTIEEKKGQLPLQELEYNSLLQNYSFTKQKFNDYMSDRETTRQTNEIADWVISSSKAFNNLKGGKVVTNDPVKLKEYNIQDAAMRKELREQFGNVKEGTLSMAIQLAMARTGKSFTFDENIYDAMKGRQGGYGGFMPQDYQSYASFLRGWSDEWRTMNRDMKSALQAYMNGDMSVVNDQNKDYLQEKAKVFMPNGLYQQYESALAMADPTYMRTSTRRYGNDNVFQDIQEVSDNPLLKAMGVSDTKDIIRMHDSNTFKTGVYKYNPETWYRQKRLLNKEIERINNGSLLPVGEEESVEDELVNSTLDALYNSLIYK